MLFLASNWGWFLLGGIILGLIAVPFAFRGFFRQAETMPSTLGQMLEGMDEVFEDESDEDDVEKIVRGSATGFARGATSFFGSAIRNMGLAVIFGFASTISFIVAAIGLIGWIIISLK